MANSTIEDLGEETTPISTDILPIVDDPAGTPVTKKVTVSNLLAVYNSQTATLTNKTLTSPTITGTGAITSGAITSSGAIQGTQVDITAQGDLRLQDQSGAEYVALEAGDTTTSYTVKLPSAIASSTGKALKVTSIAGAVQTMEWGDAGGAAAAELTSILQANGHTASNASPATEGTSEVSFWVETIDTNNQGVYVRVKKNGTYTDVQIA